MPNTQKNTDPEMSAASKARAAKQPRQAGGKFASTTNAQEQEIIDLKAALDKAHAVSNDRMDKLTDTMVMLTRAEDEIRLLTEGNKKIAEARDTWKGRAESQPDTIQGDRKQINTLRADCERHLADLAHANLLVGQGEAEREKLKQQVGNLTHDRDAMTQEVDRLTGVLETITAERDAARGEKDALARMAVEDLRQASLSKLIAQLAALVIMIVGTVIIVAQAMGGAK